MTTTTMTTEALTVLVPTNEAEPGRASLAHRPPSLDGLRLGVLDNGKPNSDRLLEALVAGLTRSTGLRTSVWRRKPAIGRLAPAAIVDELVAEADVVVTGVGDCAGCCSCSIADAVTLEQRGVPVAALCTTEFVTAGARAAAAAGAPGYGVAVIPHPLGSCTPDELAGRAADVAGRVTGLLTADAAGAGGSR
jgi:hypothetical protein